MAEHGQVGRIDLGYIHSTSYTILPALLRACRLELPAVEVRLHEIDVATQLDAVLDAHIDLMLGRLPIEHPRVETRKLLDDRMVLAVPTGHALLEGSGPVHVGRLADQRIIGYPPGGTGTLCDIVNRLFTHARLSPRFVHSAGTLHTALGLVSAAEGLAIVPASLMALRLEGVEYRQLAGSSVYAQLGFAWRADRASPVGASVIRLAATLRRTATRTARATRAAGACRAQSSTPAGTGEKP
jgi:DNA-binding transcriptional LysR family regulator